MGRDPRITAGGIWRHVNTKAVDGLVVVRDDEDRECLLRVIAYVVGKLGWELAMYVVMTTHYHLVFRTIEDDVDAGMHVINGVYAQTFNKRHGRRGHLFGARYHQELIETEPHALNVASYVPLNPVLAGLCERPEQYAWSSYGATLGLRRKPWFLTDDWLLSLFDDADVEAARRRYRAYVDARLLLELAMAAARRGVSSVPGT